VYTLTVEESGTQLTQTTIAASKVLPATAEYLVVGDRLNNYFKGVMDVNEITMPQPPGCGTDAGLPVPPDASVADTTPPQKDAGVADAQPTDGKPAQQDQGPTSQDGAKPTSDGGTKKDGSKPAGDGKPPAGKDAKGGSWDLFTPDLGAGGDGEDDGACGCRVAAAHGRSHLLPVVLLALAGLLVGLGRRRRTR